MKVKVNEDSCIGCGACQSICENVFEINDEGVPVYSVLPDYCKLYGYCQYKKKSLLYQLKENISKIIGKIFGGSK
jgi:ferredoxin